MCCPILSVNYIIYFYIAKAAGFLSPISDGYTKM
jgi:hypothetical protein